MKISPNKWKHFFAGLLMGLVLQGIGWWLLPGSFTLSLILAFSIVIAVSYGFELFSKLTGHGHYEIMDAVASVIGGALGIGIIVLFQVI